MKKGFVFLIACFAALSQAQAEGKWGAIRQSQSLAEIREIVDGPATVKPNERRVIEVFRKGADQVIEARRACNPDNKDIRTTSLMAAQALFEQVAMVSDFDAEATRLAQSLVDEVKEMARENRSDSFCWGRR